MNMKKINVLRLLKSITSTLGVFGLVFFLIWMFDNYPDILFWIFAGSTIICLGAQITYLFYKTVFKK